MMIVLLAVHVLMNVRLKQYQKAISIKLMQMYALIAAHVLMFALLRLFILNSISIYEIEGCTGRYGLFYYCIKEIETVMIVILQKYIAVFR
jgi:hypothetical protein